MARFMGDQRAQAQREGVVGACYYRGYSAKISYRHTGTTLKSLVSKLIILVTRLARFIGDRGSTSTGSLSCGLLTGIRFRLQERGILIILVMCLAGCSKPKPAPAPITTGYSVPSVATVTRPLNDAEKIDLLRKEAHKRGLKWVIMCDTEAPGFLAVAWARAGKNMADDHVDRWIYDHEPTQAIAAEHLYKHIQGPPSHPGRTKKDCPPELRGE